MSFYLSDMDGIEFVSGAKKLKFGETVPILMITSKKLLFDSDQKQASEIRGFLKTPDLNSSTLQTQKKPFMKQKPMVEIVLSFVIREVTMEKEFHPRPMVTVMCMTPAPSIMESRAVLILLAQNRSY